MTMKLRNCNISRFLILVLVAALLVPMFPEAKAEGIYKTIDFSQSVLASRINQRVSGDCAVASMATIEAYLHGATSNSDKDTVYNAVVQANGDDNYAYWSNVGYLSYDHVDWDVIYQRLTMGVPSIIHRTKGNNAAQHWSVVAGYNGSETELEWEKFIIVDVYLGSGIRDIKSAATWGSGCEINWMSLRGNGMNIQLYAKTLLHLGDEFYGSIARKDAPNQLLGVEESKESSAVLTATEDHSDRQRWKFTYHSSDGGYTIQSVHNGKVLTVSEGASADGTPICVETDRDTKYQRWFLYETEAGYMLESKGTAKAVSIYLDGSQQNAVMHTYGQTAPQNLNIHVHQYNKSDFPATCQAGSYTKYQCGSCSDSYIVPGADGPTGHKWETLEVVAADCLHTELTKIHCPTCQETKESYAEKILSDWSEKKPENMAEAAVEAEKQYRSRDRFGEWGAPEAFTLTYVKQWPDAFDKESPLYTQYNNQPKESYKTEDQWLDVVLDEEIGYLYYHWCSGNGFGESKSEEYTTFHAFYDTNAGSETDSTGAYYCPFYTNCPYSIWYYQVPVYQQTYMIHPKLPYNDQWTKWSDWSTTEVTPTDNRQVEERTLYRYVTNFGAHVYSDGTTCDICGLDRDSQKIETTPMYRLYNPNSGEHFYTGSKEERNNLTAAGWQYEGVAWNAPTKQGAPVYRLYNPNNGDHHYTMSEAERDMLVGVGWQYEGVAWNSASSSNVPMYRLFNPNADCGSHHYTGSKEEMDYLVSLGWIYEGIGWYGMLK